MIPITEDSRLALCCDKTVVDQGALAHLRCFEHVRRAVKARRRVAEASNGPITSSTGRMACNLEQRRGGHQALAWPSSPLRV